MASKNVVLYVRKNFNKLSSDDILKLKKDIKTYITVSAKNEATIFVDTVYKLKTDNKYTDETKFHLGNILKNSDGSFIKKYLNLVGFEQFPKEFIQDYFVIFPKETFNYFLTVYKFDEEFLETHFEELDAAAVFTNQYFSEDFYLKHYEVYKYRNIMDTKNDWRFPSNRSNKLKLFLKLKGVTF